MLPIRIFNLLNRCFEDGADLLALDFDPLEIRGLGITTAKEIAKILAQNGYNLDNTVWKKYLSDGIQNENTF